MNFSLPHSGVWTCSQRESLCARWPGTDTSAKLGLAERAKAGEILKEQTQSVGRISYLVAGGAAPVLARFAPGPMVLGE